MAGRSLFFGVRLPKLQFMVFGPGSILGEIRKLGNKKLLPGLTSAASKFTEALEA